MSAQKQAIINATLQSRQSRDRYTAQTIIRLTEILKNTEQRAQNAVLKYKSLGSLPEAKLNHLKGLQALQAEIRRIGSQLKKDQSLLFRQATKTAFKDGITGGIEELVKRQLPFYKDLDDKGVAKMTHDVFTLVDRSALDFMVKYNLVLAGNVANEVSEGLRNVILSGITTGKSVQDMVADMGQVVKNPESFRQAGGRVFSKAQYRMELIARTEILRAHNQGRIKFHRQVGIDRLEWMALGDERVCPVCGPLNGKTYPIDAFPQQPIHPHCRCTNLAVSPSQVCGAGKPAAKASNHGQSCILPPQTVHEMAKAKVAENTKLRQAFESGDPGQLSDLSLADIQTLAKANGVAVARTKADLMGHLAKVEPGIDNGHLKGKALKQKLASYKIGALRNKQELVSLLAVKQKAFIAAKLEAQQAKKLPAPEGLQGMSAAKLKVLAKQQGISLNMTKQNVIDLLDELEPGIDHSLLKGKDLAAAKKKYTIGVLKNKSQLIKALQKAAGNQMAEQVKEQAFQQAKQAAVTKAKKHVEEAMAKVQMLPPTHYTSFWEHLQGAEQALSKAADLPSAVVGKHAQELVIKKQVFLDQLNAMNLSALKNLAKETKLKHWQWANKKDLLTLFGEPNATEIAASKEAIEAKWTAWKVKQEKNKKSKKSSQQPEPAPIQKPEPAKKVPPPKPKNTVPKPKPEKPKSGIEALDAQWGKHTFKLEGDANVGGAHQKYFYRDEDGNRWLFKPAGEPFLAHGDEVAYKVARLIDPQAIEARAIKLDGKVGSIQKMRTDLKKELDFGGTPPSKLTTNEIAQLQREHVIDWLISNHDGHPEQFLRGKDGKVYGIDKSQLFKHLGQDKLDIEYHPNGVFGEREPFYNTLFREVKKGTINVDPNHTLAAVKLVEQIDDDRYLEMLKPYAERRFADNPSGLEGFYKMALARKQYIRKDFEVFYGKILGQRDFSFTPKTIAKSATRFGKNELELINQASEHGWQGKALAFDEDDVEDQNALLYVEEFEGKTRSVLRMKLLPKADKRLMKSLKKFDIQVAKQKDGPLDTDIYSKYILAAVKTINHHSHDNAYNNGHIKKALSFKSKLAFLETSDDPVEAAMATDYLNWLETIEKAYQKKQPIKNVFTPYQPEAGTQNGNQTLKITKGKVRNAGRILDRGELRYSGHQTNAGIFGHDAIDGEEYEIDFPGGHLVYRPWSETNLYAHQGNLEIFLEGKPDAKTLDKALDVLESLKIKTNMATPEDQELLYLHKQAYITKVHLDDGYKAMARDLDKAGASKEIRLQKMRGFWNKRLGVPDVTKLPSYQPGGEYQYGFKGGKEAGYRHQYRFDLSDEDLEQEMAGYSLHHELTNAGTTADFVNTVLTHNGAMISTVEKMRIGVPVKGKSPYEDMGTGGANYFFTRIKPLRPGKRRQGLFFKKRLLRRMDAISYNHDAYGKVTSNYVTKNRSQDPSDWKAFSNLFGNETIFKDTVTFLDNIEELVVHTEHDRKAVLATFRKHKISRLPDGRKVREIVKLVKE